MGINACLIASFDFETVLGERLSVDALSSVPNSNLSVHDVGEKCRRINFLSSSSIYSIGSVIVVRVNRRRGVRGDALQPRKRRMSYDYEG
jgi:hypothetical protein